MPPQQPVTPVVINYNYGSVPPPQPDQTADRGPASAPDDNSSGPSHYLIAFKDHTIYAATAYWVDGDTLHYFTEGNVHNQASLALVDREFTQRLNREAGLDVRLPAPSAK
jgi:endonuclease YncB( thermonuclease family)